MMKKYRKIIAYVICAALVLGCIPVSIVNAAGNVVGTGPIFIEGFVKKDTAGNSQVYIRVVKEELEDVPASGITYEFDAKDTVGSKPLTLANKNDETQPVTKDMVNSNAEITVKVSYTDVKGLAREGQTSVKIVNKQLKVDRLPDVSVINASGNGAQDGSIIINSSNNDMQHFQTTGTGGTGLEQAKDFDHWKWENLKEGSYGVKYKSSIVKATACELEELYAYYTVGVNSTPTAAPTYQPTAVPTQVPTYRPPYVPPISTQEPEPTAEPTIAPTQVPEPTVEPTVEPTIAPTAEPTVEPTEAPEPTVEPTQAPPAETTEPTQAPPADMSKPGTKVTQDGNSFTSTGNNEVAYSGSTTAKKSITVPDTVTINGKKYPVTEISSKAFSGTNVQKVTLGKNVKEIGKAAFKNCKSLKSVTFPSKLAKLDEQAFYGCVKLSSASLPSSTKTIGKKAFKNCKGLKKFKIGKTPVKTKKGMVMFGATGGTKISIGANALENCINLRSVIINSQVTKIGNATFKNCKKLASMLVKTLKLKTVGNKALQGVSNCKISVPTIRLKKYRTLFTNKGQGKKVVIAKV